MLSVPEKDMTNIKIASVPTTPLITVFKIIMQNLLPNEHGLKKFPT